jgi:hypothetical protein
MKGWQMNVEVERVWKEAAIAIVKVLSRHLPGDTDENHENSSQDSRSLGRDMNEDLPNTKQEC